MSVYKILAIYPFQINKLPSLFFVVILFGSNTKFKDSSIILPEEMVSVFIKSSSFREVVPKYPSATAFLTDSA